MDLKTCFPYDDSLTRFTISGAQIFKMFEHFMRKENRNGEGENYQVNMGIQAIYSESEARLLSLKKDKEDIKFDEFYTICLQGYHYKNSKTYLNISKEELELSGKTKVISTSAQEVIEEFLRNNQNTFRETEGRLVYEK